MTLHDELSRIADTAPRPPIDPALWDRGRALRRRDRLVTAAVALTLVVVVGGLAALLVGPPEAVGPTDGGAPAGAIPSSIQDVSTDGPLESDLAIGQGSVAFVSSSGVPVVIGATDGATHLLDLASVSDGEVGLVALAPDGRHLAWVAPERIHSVDLDSGEVTDLVPNGGYGVDEITSLAWLFDSRQVTYEGTHDGERVAGRIEFDGPSESDLPAERLVATSMLSPSLRIGALPSPETGPSARFVRSPRRNEQRPDGGFYSVVDAIEMPRELPGDLYPGGAAVRPLGWASDDLLLAEVDAPAGSYVEGRHLALFTAPSRPESEWTFRIVVRDLPDAAVSVAVDLVPDLDGTSSQPLTRDFGEPSVAGGLPWRDRLPVVLGGLLALLAGLAFIRSLQRR